MANTSWKGRNVLVTGATGMVGSHVAERLVSEGANVIALARSRDPRAYFFSQHLEDKCVLAYGDLKDAERMLGITERYEISCIMHLGAQPIVTTALSNPLETFQSNINGTLNILEAARRSSGVEAVVVASSDKAYGKSDVLPYTEDMALRGDAPYEASKSCADIISLTYAKTYSLPVAVTRFGNIYGPGDLNFNRIVPGAIRAALTKQPLDIRSDGTMVREYLHVSDAAHGYLLLAENIGSAKGEAFNFSSGERLTVLEVVKRMSSVMDSQIPTRILNTAKHEIREQTLSSEKARSRLGWTAKHSLETGIAKTLPWYQSLLAPPVK